MSQAYKQYDDEDYDSSGTVEKTLVQRYTVYNGYFYAKYYLPQSGGISRAYFCYLTGTTFGKTIDSGLINLTTGMITGSVGVHHKMRVHLACWWLADPNTEILDSGDYYITESDDPAPVIWDTGEDVSPNTNYPITLSSGTLSSISSANICRMIVYNISSLTNGQSSTINFDAVRSGMGITYEYVPETFRYTIPCTLGQVS